jgi:hypothetical protein
VAVIPATGRTSAAAHIDRIRQLVWVAIRARLQLERNSLPYFTDLLLLRLPIARQSLNVIRDNPPTEQAVERPL